MLNTICSHRGQLSSASFTFSVSYKKEEIDSMFIRLFIKYCAQILRMGRSRVRKLFDKMSAASWDSVNRQEDAFNCDILPKISSQTKWICTGTGISFSARSKTTPFCCCCCSFFFLCPNTILSGDRNSGFWFATCALSMLSQSNIHTGVARQHLLLLGLSK